MWNARRARSYNEELEIGYPGDDFLGNRYETNNFSDEDNPDEQDPVTAPQWVQLDVETPNEIDEEFQASYHRYVQLAKQFNWDQILKKMHAVYMVKDGQMFHFVHVHLMRSDYCSKAFWLRRKFNNAVVRHLDTSAILLGLLDLPNPFSSSGQNYTKAYFKKQWKLQHKFKSQHSTSDEKEKKDLVALYKKEAALERLRVCLINPQLYLSTDSKISLLQENIARMSDEVAMECIRLGTDLPTVDAEEQKLRLLLWDSKSELYVQLVHLHAEQHPIDDAQRQGSQLGTKLKEKIFKAIQSRRPAVNKLLNVFNQHYEDYKQRFPTQQLCVFEPFPLTYETFSAMPLDHAFWNDGLYYHSQQPWATNANVCTGINCVLILSRVQEEFELLAQELTQAVGWSIGLYENLSNCIAEIQKALDQFNHSKNSSSNNGLPNSNSENNPFYHITNLPLEGLSTQEKLQVVQKELQQQLMQHGRMVEDWSRDVNWLWSRCQPPSNQLNALLIRWLELVTKVVSNTGNVCAYSHVVDEGLEDVILGVDFDDGEEANNGLVGEYNNAVEDTSDE
ncbi:hypothetical protein PCASD_12996 [Puccinia coronata f. sp. avenae]|uniref:CxC1-like cysteine cluster associated with KDZ transposases domain-containing protein n=1 Tax=Puccinia coronata f. sp. avenae TaxID=200324 RepID=A0A2N5UBJ2_9BASI|nr:hypothetical protein PCASD_12996 [Puccinia coronata f. sp. avenae]